MYFMVCTLLPLEGQMDPKTVIIVLVIALAFVCLYYFLVRGTPRTRKKKGRPSTKRELTDILKQRMPRIRGAKKGRISHNTHKWLLRVAHEISRLDGVYTKDLTTEELFLVLYVINRLVYTTGTPRQEIRWLKNYFTRVIIVHRAGDCQIRCIRQEGHKYNNCFEVKLKRDPELCTHIPIEVVQRGDLERKGKKSARAVLAKHLH